MKSVTALKFVSAFAVLPLALAACGNNDASDPAPETTTVTTSPTAVIDDKPAETPPPEAESPIQEPEPRPEGAVEPIQQSPEAAPAPVIVDCQTGLGPIVTYWSDGTVTGYSDYCQSVHDEVLRGEREANTFECDGTVCRNPYTGVEMPDPNATHVPDYSGGPSSGEIQMRYACEEGYAEPGECERLGFPYGE